MAVGVGEKSGVTVDVGVVVRVHVAVRVTVGEYTGDTVCVAEGVAGVTPLQGPEPVKLTTEFALVSIYCMTSSVGANHILSRPPAPYVL
jgi:hypothetical protein